MFGYVKINKIVNCRRVYNDRINIGYTWFTKRRSSV